MNKISNKEYNIDFLKSQVDYIVSRLGGGRKISDSDNATYQFQTFCPAHDDHNPSLSIGISKSKPHRILFHCYAGCKQKEVIKAIEEKTGVKISNSPPLEEKKESQDQYKIAEEVNELFNEASSEEVIKHPYIRKKNIKPYGDVRAKDNELIIPIVDFEGTFHGCQIIYEDGSKKNKKGSKITGNFFVFGEENFKRIYITEGYATACSIYQALEEMDIKSLMFVTFTCVNLLPVARKVRDRYLDAEIVICADNDQWTEGNPGVTKAIETAKKVLAKIAIPHFKDTSTKPTDFNDLYVLEGIEEVKTQLKNAEYPRLTSEDREKILNQIAELSPSEYNLVRKRIAEMLNITLTTLDKEIKERRKRIKSDQKNKKEKHAEILERLAYEKGIELFNSSETGYVTFPYKGHKETCCIDDEKFKNWLLLLFKEEIGRHPGSQALQECIEILNAEATIKGQNKEVFVRIAIHNDKDDTQRIYLDLCNENREVIEISSEGWKITKDPPVKFIRPEDMLPLPYPEEGDINLLKKFLNYEEEDDFYLMLEWLVSTFKPDIDHPILILQGAQGSAKTTTTLVLRKLIDPSKTPHTIKPRDEDAIFVTTKDSWIIAYDNLSGIKEWVSDILCSLVTEGGVKKRKLFTNNKSIASFTKRPFILNGIDEIATRPDLLDRAIILTLPTIKDTNRKIKSEFWKEFEEARPRILGGLLNIVSKGLKNLPNTKLKNAPRLSDFAKWIMACGLPIEPYLNNRKDALTNLAEYSTFCQLVVKILEYNEGKWEGTATELLDELNEIAKDTEKKYLPQSPRGISNKLKREEPILNTAGVKLTKRKTKNARLIKLEMEKTKLEKKLDQRTNKLLYMSVDSTIPKDIANEELANLI